MQNLHLLGLAILCALVVSIYCFTHPNLLAKQIYVSEAATNKDHVVTKGEFTNEKTGLPFISVAKSLEVPNGSTLISRDYADSRYTRLGATYNYREISTSQTLTNSDDVIGVDTTSNAVTITLPKITGAKDIYIIDIAENATANNITINANASDAINDASGSNPDTIAITADNNSLVFRSNLTDRWLLF